jgi:hypothetical protein
VNFHILYRCGQRCVQPPSSRWARDISAHLQLETKSRSIDSAPIFTPPPPPLSCFLASSKLRCRCSIVLTRPTAGSTCFHQRHQCTDFSLFFEHHHIRCLSHCLVVRYRYFKTEPKRILFCRRRSLGYAGAGVGNFDES